MDDDNLKKANRIKFLKRYTSSWFGFRWSTLSIWLVGLAFVIMFSKSILSNTGIGRKLGNLVPFSMVNQFYHAKTSHDDDLQLIVHQAFNLLEQKRSILNIIKPEDYIKKDPSIFNASVGGHIRHSLDHFNTLLSASDKDGSGVVNYDERARNTNIEINPQAALDQIDILQRAIRTIDLEKSIFVTFMGDEKTFKTYKIKSTVQRELSFVSHHAVHHLSTIKLIMNNLSYEFPKNSPIGIALSTAKDMQKNQ